MVVRKKIATTRIILYLVVLSVALWLWITRNKRDYGEYQTGAFLGVCLFVIAFPVAYIAAILIKHIVKGSRANTAGAEALNFLKSYTEAMLFTPILKKRKR